MFFQNFLFIHDFLNVFFSRKDFSNNILYIKKIIVQNYLFIKNCSSKNLKAWKEFTLFYTWILRANKIKQVGIKMEKIIEFI